MRALLGPVLAAAVVTCGVVASVAPALAGADDGGTKAFWTDSSAAPAAAPRTNEQYRAIYPAPQQTAPATAPQSDPDYFYHAQGTMGH